MTCAHCHENPAFKFARTDYGRRWLCRRCFEHKATTGDLPDLGYTLPTVCSSPTKPPSLDDIEESSRRNR